MISNFNRQRFMLAIAFAERGGTELLYGSVMRNNPGDIMSSEGRLLEFPTIAAGWDALRNEIDLIYTGQSKHYHLDMTIEDMGKVYTGMDNADAWSDIVAQFLNVPKSAKLKELA